MKIVTVIGARPQFIKAAVVSREIRTQSGVREVIVHTGQHYDRNMSEVFFEELDIPEPDHNLGIGSGTHGVQTGRMLAALEEVFQAESPDWVLVYGDTNSTLAGALAAAKLHIRVAHVEAGLRSFNRRMPEEINRVLTDHVSELLLAPTETAVKNLHAEGVPEARIERVGDVMLDAALYYGERAASRSHVLESLGLSPKQYILATVHRAENTDDSARLSAILRGLSMVAAEIPVVLPLHPRTRRMVEESHVRGLVGKQLRLVPPVGYLDMVLLEMYARLIVTDSGGVQKEAYFHGVPCVTLRDETEWVELVESGWNRLQPPVGAAEVAAGVLAPFGRLERDEALYGEGRAAVAVLESLRATPAS